MGPLGKIASMYVLVLAFKKLLDQLLARLCIYTLLISKEDELTCRSLAVQNGLPQDTEKKQNKTGNIDFCIEESLYSVMWFHATPWKCFCWVKADLARKHGCVWGTVAESGHLHPTASAAGTKSSGLGMFFMSCFGRCFLIRELWDWRPVYSLEM